MTSYSKTGQVQGKPNATARLIIYKPDKKGVEELAVKLDAQGQATFKMEVTPNQKN